MKRLIACGCSFTYGQGLLDCVGFNGGPGTQPSKYAWPQVCADVLGIPCVNIAECGLGNKHIAYRILNFDFEPGDIVVVMWSFFTRHCVILDKNDVLDIYPGLDPDQYQEPGVQRLAYEYYSSELLSNEKNQAIENLMYIKLVDLFLKNKNIPMVHATLQDQYFKQLSTVHMASDRENFKYVRNTFQKFPKEQAEKKFGSNTYDIGVLASSQSDWFDIPEILTFDDGIEYPKPAEGHPDRVSHKDFGYRLAKIIAERQA